MTVVDVVANNAAGYERSNDVTVAALSEGTAQAMGATVPEQARDAEREVAALDLTDAAQAMTRSQPKGDVDAPVDSSQVDLAVRAVRQAPTGTGGWPRSGVGKRRSRRPGRAAVTRLAWRVDPARAFARRPS